jgi:DNA polymerase (family X)
MRNGEDAEAAVARPAQNQFIADRLRETAALLEQQGGNRFRVAAYRKAAETLESLPQDVLTILETKGFDGLTALPGIGVVIGNAIVEIVTAGQWSQLERLRGALDPEALFRNVPGVGPKLARRIIDELNIDTLEALECAAHDGQLQNVSGFGPRRAAIVRSVLTDMLRRGRWRMDSHRAEPGIDILLDVDREYREKAEGGKLRRIAPKRFNPTGEAWLPILHTERGPWLFTVMYSNTALAHKLGRTRDWVLVYFETDSLIEGQRTVVTEKQGLLKGRRMVRGREKECAEYYKTFFAPPQVA